MEATIKGKRMQPIDPDVMNLGAAVAGSVTGQVLSKNQATWRKVLGLVLVSAFAGIFLGPAVSLLIGVQSPIFQAAINYIVGLVGVALCAAIMCWAEGQSFPALIAFVMGLRQQAPPAVPVKETEPKE